MIRSAAGGDRVTFADGLGSTLANNGATRPGKGAAIALPSKPSQHNPPAAMLTSRLMPCVCIGIIEASTGTPVGLLTHIVHEPPPGCAGVQTALAARLEFKEVAIIEGEKHRFRDGFNCRVTRCGESRARRAS